MISGVLLVELKASSGELLLTTQFYLAQFGLFVFIGILLGFCDGTVSEVHRSGHWKIHGRRIGIIGIPVGVLACSYIIYWITDIPGVVHNLFAAVLSIDCGQVVAAQVILGYILVTSFYKKEN